MRVRLCSIRWEAKGISSFILRSTTGATLPAFSAGAHVDVRLAAALTRSYSLVNDPNIREYYEIAVHHAADSRGGSKHIHEKWRVGDVIEISEPKNNFALVEDAEHTVLIAGGIGITPMLSMIATLERLGRRWNLHYVAATPDRAAYVDTLRKYGQAEVVFDGMPGGRRLDLQGICEAAPEGAHLYCCGPAGMLDAFLVATSNRSQGHAHIEYFSATSEVASEGEYKLKLARSGRTIDVAAGETMLDALLSAGVDVGFACEEGVCGTCRVGVLAGTPDHRDHFLTAAERAANRSIMVCCSGSKTPSLVLDL